MRTNLIHHFHCGVCGSVLNLLSAEEAERVKAEQYSSGNWRPNAHDAEPTGALVRYAETIFIEPCRRCIERYTGPAKALASAIRAISEAETK